MTGQTAANEDASERLSEISAILVAGLQRLLGRQSSGELPSVGESSLHYAADQSAHVETCSEMVSA